MKRVIPALLFVVFVFLFSACGAPQPGSSAALGGDSVPPATPVSQAASVSAPSSSTSPPPSQPAESTAGASSQAAGSAAASQAPPAPVQPGEDDSAPQDPNAEKSVIGTIDSAGMGFYRVLLSDGLALEFIFEGADLTGLKDTLPGTPVTVYYTGVITGNDTSGATVTRVVSS